MEGGGWEESSLVPRLPRTRAWEGGRREERGRRRLRGEGKEGGGRREEGGGSKKGGKGNCTLAEF